MTTNETAFIFINILLNFETFFGRKNYHKVLLVVVVENFLTVF